VREAFVKIPITLLAITLAASASAQTTWHNFQFGMSADQVRSAATAQGLTVTTNDDGNLEGTNDTQIMLPGLMNTVPARPEFRFTTSGGLMDITLHLDFSATKQNFAQYHTDDDVLAFASDRLICALTGIYAAPVLTTPGCGIEPATTPPATCTTMWHGTGQSVSLEWTNHTSNLFIRYQMLSPDL
jgi:hypothetical protein